MKTVNDYAMKVGASDFNLKRVCEENSNSDFFYRGTPFPLQKQK